MLKISIALSCIFIVFAAVVSSLSLSKTPRNVKIIKQSDCNYQSLVPNIVGLDFNTVSNNYNLVKLSEEFSEEIPCGCIITQSPESGAMSKENETIMATVSKGSKFAEVPDVVGKTIGEASVILSNACFVPRAMIVPSNGEEGIVMGYYGLSYEKGIKLEKFKEIILEVSG